MSQAEGSPTRNRLLAAMSEPLRRRLGAAMQSVRLVRGDMLHAADHAIEHVFFVRSGWVSLVLGFNDGFQAEVGLIGAEGMTGLSVFHGHTSDMSGAIVQGAGDAWRIDVRAFRRELDASPELRNLMLRYSEVMYSQAKQVSACNGHHTLEQRLARWLLLVHDRAGSDEIAITQELLAQMLCVHRPSVTAVSGRLQRAGLIRHAGGVVTILSRHGLEDAACECYDALRQRALDVFDGPTTT